MVEMADCHSRLSAPQACGAVTLQRPSAWLQLTWVTESQPANKLPGHEQRRLTFQDNVTVT